MLPVQAQLIPCYWSELSNWMDEELGVIATTTMSVVWCYSYGGDVSITQRWKLEAINGNLIVLFAVLLLMLSTATVPVLRDMINTCYDVHFIHSSVIPRIPREYPPLRHDKKPLLAPPMYPTSTVPTPTSSTTTTTYPLPSTTTKTTVSPVEFAKPTPLTTYPEHVFHDDYDPNNDDDDDMGSNVGYWSYWSGPADANED
jgi:hypothetical protein